ncbi:MAG: hypothetical protein HYR94_06005 [Chloroflexi bacterium]|nr:hypothetical protein [Chloroflexota bacterium]
MTFSLKSILALWLIPLLLTWSWPIQADEPANLYLQNLPLQDDRLLVVTVQLKGVADLYGAEIQLAYDPAQLKVRDEDPRLEGIQIAPGPLLAFDDRFVAVNNVDTQAGLINFVFTLLKPASPINSDGVVATVVFEIAGNGPFELGVAQAKLVSSGLTAIPVTTTGLSLNGLPDLAAAEPATTSSPLGFGWVIVGALSLLFVLFLLLSIRAKWWMTGPAGARPALRRIPGAAGASASARTSALLTEQGNRAAHQGDLAQAYERFSQAIELDPANAAAWLGKGLVAQQETEKRICFQRVLALDPQNLLAQVELQQLDAAPEDLANENNSSP